MPALGAHTISNVVDIESVGEEGDDGDKRAADDFQIGVEFWFLADCGLDFLHAADDLVAGVDVAVFALLDKRRPASCDQRAGARAGD